MVDNLTHNGMTSAEVRGHVTKLAELDGRCTALESRLDDLEKQLDKIEAALSTNRNYVIVTLGGVVVTLALELIKYL